MPDIEVVESGRLVTVTINRPDGRNSLTLQTLAELYHVFVSLRERHDLSVLVLTGAGSIFCPGGDARYLASGGSPDPLSIGESEEIYRAPAILRTLPQVTIAAINGACAGAGLAFACACDLRYTIEGARFNTAFLARGVSGDMSLPWSLQRVVGQPKAIELSLITDIFTGSQAKEIGLVHDAHPAEEFDAKVQEIVAGLLDRDPHAMRTIKKHYIMAAELDAMSYADLETRTHIHRLGSAGFQDFVNANGQRKQAADS